jgi:hypothetical protein
VVSYSWPANGLYCASPRAGLGTAEQFLNGLCLGNDRMGTGIARRQDPYRPEQDGYGGEYFFSSVSNR